MQEQQHQQDLLSHILLLHQSSHLQQLRQVQSEQERQLRELQQLQQPWLSPSSRGNRWFLPGQLCSAWDQLRRRAPTRSSATEQDDLTRRHADASPRHAADASPREVAGDVVGAAAAAAPAPQSPEPDPWQGRWRQHQQQPLGRSCRADGAPFGVYVLGDLALAAVQGVRLQQDKEAIERRLRELEGPPAGKAPPRGARSAERRSAHMGNQECSVKQAPCFDSARAVGSQEVGSALHAAPEAEPMEAAQVPSRSLAVEAISARRDPPQEAEPPPAALPAVPPPATVDTVDWGHLPDTYFDCELGESPVLEDDTLPQRFRYEFQSGAIYDGDWLHGNRHGVGKQIWPDGTEYFGQWLSGKANGLGHIKHSDGDSYDGEWVNGRAHGVGVYRFQDGAARYEGQFRCDHRDGLGVETWVDDGSCYAGGFRQGQKSGYGSNTWPDGTVYHGSWRENCPSGHGEYSLNGGSTFRGQWENSMPHGIGRYEWPGGKSYCGRYKFDKKEGFGILTEASGEVRQGFWVNGDFLDCACLNWATPRRSEHVQERNGEQPKLLQGERKRIAEPRWSRRGVAFFHRSPCRTADLPTLELLAPFESNPEKARLRLSLRAASGALGGAGGATWRRGLVLRTALVAGGVGWDAVAGNLAGCSGAGSWAWAVQCLAGAVWDEAAPAESVSFGIALDCCAQGRLWSEAAGLCVRLRQRGKAPRAGAFGAAISLLRWLALGRVEGPVELWKEKREDICVNDERRSAGVACSTAATSDGACGFGRSNRLRCRAAAFPTPLRREGGWKAGLAWHQAALPGLAAAVALRSHSRPEQATFSSQNRMQLRPEGTYQPSPKRPQLRFVLSPARIRPGQQRTEEGAEVRHRLKKSQAPEELLGCFEVALQEGVVDASVVGAALQRCGHSLWWKALLEVYDAKEHLGVRLSCMEQSIVFSALASCVRPHVLTEPRRQRALEIAREVWKEAVPEADPDFNCVLSSALKLCFQLRSAEATQWAETLWEWSEGEIFQKSIVTYSSWLLLLERLQRRDKVDVMLSKVLQGDVRPNAVLLGGLLNIAAELRDWRRADALWQLGKTRHVKVNGLAHAAYAKAHFLSGRPGAGLEILHRMVASGAGEDYQDYRYAVDFLQMQVVVCHSAPSPANLARLRGFLPKGRGLLGACPGSGLQCWERLEQVAQRLLAQPSSVSFEEVLVTWPAQRDSVMKDWQGCRAGSGYLWDFAACGEEVGWAALAGLHSGSLLHDPDLAMLNAAIAAGQRGQAWLQCLELLRAGVQPDAVSRNSAGAALAAAGRWRKAFFAVEVAAGDVAMALKGDTCTEVTLGVLGRACREAQVSCGDLGGVPGARRPGQLGDEMAPTCFGNRAVGSSRGFAWNLLGAMRQLRRGRGGVALGVFAWLGALRLACLGFVGCQPRPPRSRARLASPAGGTEASLDERDVDFMERLRGLAAEVLALPNLTAHQRLVWATSLRLDAVPVQELPPWFWERQNVTRRCPGVDLLSLDGRRGIRCCAEAVEFQQVRRFLRLAKWVYKASDCVMVTSSPDVLSKQSQKWLRRSKAKRQSLSFTAPRRSRRLSRKPSKDLQADSSDPPLRPCQQECLEACAKGARVIEMACGTGKTRVMKELVRNISGRVLVTVPLRTLLEQFAEDFPHFCKVGTGYNKDINWNAKAFLAVTDSVRMLKRLEFDAIFLDEAHHPLPAGLPKSQEMYRFSATHPAEPDFRYSMGQAMEDTVLCDYDLIVPVVTPQHGHTYLSLADLLLKQAGRFRRVLAYCNSVREAKSFLMVLEKLGMAAWHMNGDTPPKKRKELLEQFAGALQKPVHVLVTVEVLGEGINIPNADTCMFVEPRGSYRSIVQAIGRVLRPHPTKPLAHIVLPAVSLTQNLKRDVPAAAHMEHEQAGAEALPAFGYCSLSSPDALHTGLLSREIHSAGHPGHMESLEDDGKVLNSETLQSNGFVERSEDGARQHKAIKATQRDLGSSPFLPDLASAGAEGPCRSKGSARLEAGRVVSAGAGATLKPRVAKAVSRHAFEEFEATKGHEAWASANAPLSEFQKQVSLNKATLGAPKLSAADGKEVKRIGAAAGQSDWTPVGSADCVEAPATSADRPTGLAKPMQPFSGASSRHRECKQNAEQGRSMSSALLEQRQSTRQRQALQVRAANNGHGFSSELQRFFAALVEADKRILGPGQAFGHRVQIVDCTTAQSLCLKRVISTVYAELAAALCNITPWDARLIDLEKFVAAIGRLPRLNAKLRQERLLANWLCKQGKLFRARQLLPHRSNKLLNSSSPLVRARVHGWLRPHRAFELKCHQLREFILATGSMPLLSRAGAQGKLASWLYVRARQRKLSEAERRLLEQVHPLVEETLHSWAKAPVQVSTKLWKRHQLELLDFVSREGCLPGSATEPKLYCWLQLQRGRFCAGILPAELGLDLQSSDPRIAEYLEGGCGDV
ncbi:unnamed protein product [Effrenium voratum]|nr:unnamed protein product [Effrenium voratum]